MTAEKNKDSTMPLTDLRLGIVGKGGAGKSTATIFMAYALRTYGYGVCILDADSTNIGMHRALGIEEPPAPLIDYFGGMVFSGGAVTCPVDDPTPLPDCELKLEQLPAGYQARNPDGITLLTAGKIGDLGPGAGCDGPVNKIARDVRISSDAEPLVTIVDFKAGFEDSARGAITGLDWVIAVVDPTHASIQMAWQMKAMVTRMKEGIPPATEHLEDMELVRLAQALFRDSSVNDVLAVLNRVRDNEMEQFLRSTLQEGAVQTIGCLPVDPGLTDTWLQGDRITSSEIGAAAGDAIRALERVELDRNTRT